MKRSPSIRIQFLLLFALVTGPLFVTMAQPVIRSIDKLNQQKEMTFQSSAGKNYKVSQRKGSCSSGEKGNGHDEDDNNKSCNGDDFDGKARKAAKTSFASGSARDIDDYKAFISTLPKDKFMCKTRQPEISQAATSDRVDEEKINVKVTKIWLYAFKRQKDEDYHLMVGISPKYSIAKKAKFYNMEISGYPENEGGDFDKIKKSRQAFESFFNISDCDVVCRNYVDFRKNPIRIEVTGSMFYDKDHCSNLATVSPSGYPIKTAWEVHPIKSIKFIED